MSRLRIPIYAKVLLWFLINLLLLFGLGYGFMRLEFRLGLDWMLAGPAGERIDQIASSITTELRALPESEWPAVLQRHDAAQGIVFALFGSDGTQVLGQSVTPPNEIRVRLIDKRTAEGVRSLSLQPPPPPPRAGGPPPDPPPRGGSGNNGNGPPKPRFMLRSDHPTRYWAGIHLDLIHRGEDLNRPLTLVMVSDTLSANGLFFDPWPWLALTATGLLISILVWLPFVSGMTRAIHRLNAAARRIAQGRFGERVPQKRKDELGELATSVNAMAAQLGDYVSRQRRMTSDVAHELCSPLARMQMALGVVEQRAVPGQESYMAKLDAELQHMAKLVAQVLAFSKAENQHEHEAPSQVPLHELVQKIITREAADMDVQVEMPANLTLHTLADALDRAISNVLRNAVRYAAQAGPIRISATREGDHIIITVTDQGAGVPPEALPRLFEPFYRPETARDRHTGGSGLGLAIVQRCMESCGGYVVAHLVEPQGLAIAMVLPVAASTTKSSRI